MIYGMVTARKGSVRTKLKNLAIINGKPMMSWAIEAAIDFGAFDKVVVNADDTIFQKVADNYNVDFYLRPKELGSSDTKIDDVIFDFMNAFPKAEYVAIINTINPLQTSDEIRRVVDFFFSHNLDSVNTIEEKYAHGMVGGTPINFSKSEKLEKTQNLDPLQLIVYSTMMWKVEAFKDAMKKYGCGLFCGNFGFVPVSKKASILAKEPEDIFIIDAIMKNLSSGAELLQWDLDGEDALSE